MSFQIDNREDVVTTDSEERLSVSALSAILAQCIAVLVQQPRVDTFGQDIVGTGHRRVLGRPTSEAAIREGLTRGKCHCG